MYSLFVSCLANTDGRLVAQMVVGSLLVAGFTWDGFFTTARFYFVKFMMLLGGLSRNSTFGNWCLTQVIHKTNAGHLGVVAATQASTYHSYVTAGASNQLRGDIIDKFMRCLNRVQSRNYLATVM